MTPDRQFHYFLLTSLLFTFLLTNANNMTHVITKPGDRKLFDTTRNSALSDTTFKLGYFASLPDTLDGCSESYCYDKAASLDKNFIFVGNLQDLGLIKIDGKVIYLKKDTIDSKQINQTKFREVYKGQGWKIILILTTIRQIDEVSTDQGTMEIIYHSYKQIIKIKGNSGC